MAPRGTVRSSRFTTVLLPKCLVSLWVAMMVSMAVGLPLRFPGTDVWFMIGRAPAAGPPCGEARVAARVRQPPSRRSRRRPRRSDAPLAVDPVQLLLDQRPQLLRRQPAG